VPYRITASAPDQVLYRFRPPDGRDPTAGLLDLSGTLYGTTYRGGLSHKGAVYSISATGTQKVIYRFRGGSDGENPAAGLIDVNGTLYGTTEYGGAYGWGTVFSIAPSGTEAVLHSFKGFPNDGQRPTASLLNVNGTLYGTTQFGGSGSCGGGTGSGYNGCGSVFKITTSGRETVLHNFDGSHGYRPAAGLINVNGMLYGTTLGNTVPHHGTIFQITTAGKENTIYYFNGPPSDGASVYAGLINVNGTLYGVTAKGGANNDGTFFAVTPSGSETMLYSFEGYPSDGASPETALIDMSGTLYGTTDFGGPGNNGSVFQLSTSGVEHVLYMFKGGSDGANPQAALINVSGEFYGTTSEGGARHCGNSYGCGTVFTLTP
jgi:uncharacterized repeat protein (TIGR03803 family)